MREDVQKVPICIRSGYIPPLEVQFHFRKKDRADNTKKENDEDDIQVIMGDNSVIFIHRELLE